MFLSIQLGWMQVCQLCATMRMEFVVAWVEMQLIIQQEEQRGCCAHFVWAPKELRGMALLLVTWAAYKSLLPSENHRFSPVLFHLAAGASKLQHVFSLPFLWGTRKCSETQILLYALRNFTINYSSACNWWELNYYIQSEGTWNNIGVLSGHSIS